MKSNTFVTRMASGAVASTVVGACFLPQSHSAPASLAFMPVDVVLADRMPAPEQTSETGPSGSVTVAMTTSPEEWTKQMEREFRQLALREAEGDLTAAQVGRLEHLSAWRDRLVEPRSTEEVLQQLRRDRLLEKIADALKEYVEFQQGTDKARPATR